MLNLGVVVPEVESGKRVGVVWRVGITMPVAFDGRLPSSELDCTRIFSFGSVFSRFIMVGTVVADGVGVEDSTVNLVEVVGDDASVCGKVSVGYCTAVGVGGEVGVLEGE